MTNRKLSVLLVLTSLVAGIFGGGIGAYFYVDVLSKSSQNTGYLAERDIKESYVEKSDVIEAIDKANPSVVSIIASKELERIVGGSPFGFFGFPFGGRGGFQEPEIITERREIGGGTGFIVSKDGLMITNKHVVDDEEADYKVFMSDDTELFATVVSTDPFNDIAVVQLFEDENKTRKPSNLPIADLGDSDSIRVGATVIAIGNALSEFDNTTTAGIVSGIGREIVAGSSGGFGSEASRLSGLIQTDASINPGNSGGPLINAFGEVIGINTAVAEANGIGFAIPVNDVKQALESIKRRGKIVRPYIGVRYIGLNPQISAEFDLPVEYGAYLQDDVENRVRAVLEDGPAFDAGLQSGDIIVSVDGINLDEDTGLQDIVRKKMAGDEIELEVYRNGREIEVELTLGEIE